MIFYFSGTGNTAWAAETIAQSLNEKLVFIPEHIDKPYTLKLAPHESHLDSVFLFMAGVLQL